MMQLAELWPLFGLVLRTPRLSLTPVRDGQLPELVDRRWPASTIRPKCRSVCHGRTLHATCWSGKSSRYEANGVSDVVSRPGEVTRQLHLRLEAARFNRPDWSLEVDGLEPALHFLGARG